MATSTMMAHSTQCAHTAAAGHRLQQRQRQQQLARPLPRLQQQQQPVVVRRQRQQHAAAAPRTAVVAAASPLSNVPKQQMLVFVPPHPLVKHWLAVARNSMSPPAVFRSAIAELGRILIYEAAREWLETAEMDVMTPMGVMADATVVDPAKPVKVVPVLRAGMVLLEQAAAVIPSQEVYHVGLVRDDATLEASWYLNKLPEKFSEDDRVLVTDIMLATGGTIVQVLDEIMKRGAAPANVRLVSVVAAPPALTKLSEKFPGMQVYAAMIDAEVNEQGYIVPGLGDAGDRAYGTTK